MPPFAYSDQTQTIRVPKLAYAPSRRLPKTFARERPKRWPYLLLAGCVAFSMLVAAVIDLAGSDRSDQAEAVLRTLGR